MKNNYMIVILCLLLFAGCATNSKYQTDDKVNRNPKDRYYSSKNRKNKKGNKSSIEKKEIVLTESGSEILKYDPNSTTNSSVKEFYAVCSYYGKKFHGRPTANGETYDMYKDTCAHKSLPFGTILSVTNEDNGKSVMVRVNDRGPFIEGRDIDLSYGAAKKIGMTAAGVKKLKVRIVGF